MQAGSRRVFRRVIILPLPGSAGVGNVASAGTRFWLSVTRTANENAHVNCLGERVTGLCSNLLSALAPRPHFDVIISSPPSFPGEPRDLADRAWHAGPEYRDIVSLFDQARERLAPGGRFYLLLSSDSDVEFLGALIERARFRARMVEQYSIFIETFILYELRAQ